MNQGSNHLKLANSGKELPAWKKAVRFLCRLSVVIVMLLMLKYGEVFFRVNEVRVEGPVVIPSEEIIAAAQIKNGMSIFLLREQRITDQIRKQFPRVETVKLNRYLPDTVVISISERDPVGYILTETGYWLIDRNAYCFAYSADPADDYPLLIGIGDELIMPNALLDCPIRREAVASLFLVWPGGAGLEISEINMENRNNMIVHTVDGLEIWLGDGKDMESKLILIQQSIPYIIPNPGTHLDVRSGKRLVVAKKAVIIEKEVDP